MFAQVQQALTEAHWNYNVSKDKVQLAVDVGSAKFYMDIDVSEECKTLRVVAYFDLECSQYTKCGRFWGCAVSA